jgi:3-Oxoacyl-[acyl-carrier-protein (ACP)] synthase III C terminal
LLVDSVLATAGFQPSQINPLNPYQANLRVIEAVAEKVLRERGYLNSKRSGSTSAASRPIAHDEALRPGRVNPGDRVLLIAIGAGPTSLEQRHRLGQTGEPFAGHLRREGATSTPFDSLRKSLDPRLVARHWVGRPWLVCYNTKQGEFR